MNIGLITSSEQRSQTSQRIIDAARARGHRCQEIEPSDVEWLRPSTEHERPDVLLVRIGGRKHAPARHARVRHWEQQGVPCHNTSESLASSHDKSRMAVVFGRAGLPAPHTVVVPPRFPTTEPALRSLLEGLGPAPWIVKLPVGTKGRQVMLAESPAALSALLSTFGALDQPVVLQEHVSGAFGSDVRVLVLGGQAVAAMRRRARPGEFRANADLGASTEWMELDAALATLAVRAASAFGMAIAGVDILEGDRGRLLLEVNASPGLMGIQRALDERARQTGGAAIDLAVETVRFLERDVAARRRRVPEPRLC